MFKPGRVDFGSSATSHRNAARRQHDHISRYGRILRLAVVLVVCVSSRVASGIAPGEVSRENPYTKPGTEYYLTPAAFEELLEVIRLADDAEEAARAAYHQYQEAYQALVPKILEDIANAGQDEINAIRQEYWDGRQKRGVIVTEDDHERIELESRLYREMRKRVDEEVDLWRHILLGQMRGNRRCVALFDALLAELKERCEHDDCDARLERAARIGQRRLFADRKLIAGNFAIPDLSHIVEDARAPGGELFKPYDDGAVRHAAEHDPELAAAWAAVRWEVDQARRGFEFAHESGVQRRLAAVTSPPDEVPIAEAKRPDASDRQRYAREWRQKYDRLTTATTATTAIRISIQENLGENAAQQWERRIRRSIAPYLMREFWIEGPLDAWLAAADLDADDRIAVTEIVATERSHFRSVRNRAYEAGIVYCSQYGQIHSSSERRTQYTKARQRVLSAHDAGLSNIVNAIQHIDPAAGAHLARTISRERRSYRYAFGDLYMYSGQPNQ